MGAIDVFLPFAGMLDIEKEKARLDKEIANVRGAIDRAEKQLASDFSKKAPKDIVQKMRDTLAENRERAARLDAQMASLEGRTPAKPKRVARKARAKKTRM